MSGQAAVRSRQGINGNDKFAGYYWNRVEEKRRASSAGRESEGDVNVPARHQFAGALGINTILASSSAISPCRRCRASF